MALAKAMGTQPAKGYRGIGMNGFLAKWYAATTRKSLSEYQGLARRVAAEMPPQGSALEVAPGPGYFAIELARSGDFRVTGIDISSSFVEIARTNATQAGVHVNFQLGNAANMPFDENSFDFLLCRAAFKNFTQPLQALQEMHRVLKPGGVALILDLRRDASRQAIRKTVDHMGLGFANALWTRLIFRFILLKRAYSKQEFQQFIARTKFENAQIGEDAIGLEIRLRK
jgi:ubiquinone/menaquinone biosynthesis C-methylase UbiE